MPIDYKKYPPNWKKEIVPAVIARAGNCCEQCGLTNHSQVWAVKLWIKGENGRYALRSIWFRNEQDALREAGDNRYRMRPIKVVLTISHTDHDEENQNVSLDRLKALCQVCHLRYDAKEKYRRATLKFTQPTKLHPHD